MKETALGWAGPGLDSSFGYDPENPMELQERGASVEGETGYVFLPLDWVWGTAEVSLRPNALLLALSELGHRECGRAGLFPVSLEVTAEHLPALRLSLPPSH